MIHNTGQNMFNFVSHCGFTFIFILHIEYTAFNIHEYMTAASKLLHFHQIKSMIKEALTSVTLWCQWLLGVWLVCGSWWSQQGQGACRGSCFSYLHSCISNWSVKSQRNTDTGRKCLNLWRKVRPNLGEQQINSQWTMTVSIQEPGLNVWNSLVLQ